MINNRKIKKIITILILIVMLFPYTVCFAITQEEAGIAIAQYAYSLCTTLGNNSPTNMTVYDHDNGGTTDRKYGYLLKLHSGTAQAGNGERTTTYTNKYPMDCVGFVSTVIHQSLGIGSDTEFTFFITPQSDNQGYFEKVTGDVKPGDVYRINGSIIHVMIYLGEYGGEYTIAESWSSNFMGALLTNSSASSYTPYRIKSTIVKNIDATEVKTSTDGAGLTSTTSIFNHVEMSKFYYNGIPDGKYSVTSGNILDWIVNTLKEIFIFIINIIEYIVRMVFVGWTFIVENMLTDLIQKISGEDSILKMDATDYGKDGNKYTDDNVTLEKIIFDNVKIFDVNFFTTEESEEGV